MADYTMSVRALTKAGVIDLDSDAYAVPGNTIAAGDYVFPNDGKTILLMDAGAGTTLTFTARADKYGRTEALAVAVAGGGGEIAAFGPFLPELWNDGSGMVHFTPTAFAAADIYLAVRVANPT
jgi:hypothetical protein